MYHMALKRKATAQWEGTLTEGKGLMNFGTYKNLNYTFTSRFENGEGTNPEEMIAAAHAGCYSMALNVSLERAGFLPKKVETTAEAKFEKLDAGWRITGILLRVNAQVPNITREKFMELANGAKDGCPVSNALAVDISLDANLIQ